MEGWLLKKGAVGLVRVYKRRFFRFSRRSGKLSYFESSSAEAPALGCVQVSSECEARMAGDETLSFELATPSRVYLLRAETLEDLHYWMAGLTSFIRAAAEPDFVHVQKDHETRTHKEDSVLGPENNSCDYIVIDLHSSQLTDAAKLTDLEEDSINGGSNTDSDTPVPPELAEVFRKVQVIDSAPRSAGLLGIAANKDDSPIDKATRVISCLKILLGPPPRVESGLGIGAVLRNLSHDQIEWLAPLLLALEKDDVTEVILHLASTGSSVLRVTLIALHSSGFTASSFARASVNSLYEITDAERNVLRLSDFLDENGDKLVVGQPFPVVMVHPFSDQKIDTLTVKKVITLDFLIFRSLFFFFIFTPPFPPPKKGLFNCCKANVG